MEKDVEGQDSYTALIDMINLIYSGHESRVECDKVNHPGHYQSSTGMEVIEVIEAFELNYNLGNAIKYILRSGKKGAAIEDLQKAIWYLRREKIRLRALEESDGQ